MKVPITRITSGGAVYASLSDFHLTPNLHDGQIKCDELFTMKYPKLVSLMPVRMSDLDWQPLLPIQVRLWLGTAPTVEVPTNSSSNKYHISDAGKLSALDENEAKMLMH